MVNFAKVNIITHSIKKYLGLSGVAVRAICTYMDRSGRNSDSLYICYGRATDNQLFSSSAHSKFANSCTILTVRKLGQSTLLVKVNFKGLTFSLL